MSDIVLSASVRQNLLSLQSTADLLSTTQTRLATGKKVNSALDNPTNFFTAAGLDSRASDINNLLDSIGNGVQVLQAANTGITSLQKLVDSAKSIANQALQTPTGYSTKSEASATITGATASNLLGTTTTTYASGTFTGKNVQNNQTSAADISGTTALVSATNTNSLTATPTDGTKLTVNGVDITFSTAQSTKTGDATSGFVIGVGSGSTLTVQDVLDSINSIAGAGTASISGGQITIDSKTSSGVTVGGTALAAFGLNTGGTAVGTTSDGTTDNTGTLTGLSSSGTKIMGVGTTTGGLSGLELDIAATDGGQALKITFGSGTNSFNASTGVASNVSTLDQLNTALAANNLQASIASDGKLTITTTNDHGSATIGAFSGTATGAGLFTAGAGSAPVKDANSQNTRASLIAQYNTVIDQIRTTAQDSSFNGINLLNGDQLKMVFNETGNSTISITGVTFDPAGLGLGKLTAGSDFVDNSTTNSVLTALNNASTTLRSQASAFGSNLSVVQIRQDFNKNLINVLQTGSANLTLADTNEEAANSQALSTRQSIAVSALALANQSQQSVLQLLR
ncbi:MAG: flagellar protein [Afipia felis]|nr:flagellar protein [Afipia felis]